MKFENTEVAGFESALRGMRNPMNSWDKSDSAFYGATITQEPTDVSYKDMEIGEKDMDLAKRLIKSGTEHRKFLRQIEVWVDITAPLYWWKEFDTYKVGTVANSTSTMHKLCSKPITEDCFEMNDYLPELYTKNNVQTKEMWKMMICYLEDLRTSYLEKKKEDPVKAKVYWKELVRLLPESWLQTRTISMNYENLKTIARQRKGHKLTEWSEDFMNWMHTLPYADDFIFEE